MLPPPPQVVAMAHIQPPPRPPPPAQIDASVLTIPTVVGTTMQQNQSIGAVQTDPNPNRTNPALQSPPSVSQRGFCRIGTIITSALCHRIKSIMTNDDAFSRTELDSHADSSCVGSNVVIISTSGRTVDVSAFVDELGMKTEVPIVTAAVTYTDSFGDSYILLIHEALYFPTMKHNLLNPTQIRL